MLEGVTMMRTRHVLMMFTLAVLGLLAGFGCKNTDPLADNAGGRTPADFPELASDVFQPMDGGIALSPEEIKGRNTWNLWCGGDEQFWERMSRESFGLIDLLKMIDSRKRGERFKEFGLINEPGYKQASKADQYGLWIDEAVEPEPATIDPKVYGHPTGIILVGSQPYQGGLRQLVDKDGTDGTVYVATANLNATGFSLRFTANSQAPTVQTWPKSASPIAFAVFPDRDHASIIRPDTLDPNLGTFIVRFLRLDLPNYQQFADACDARTRQTLPTSPDKSTLHTFQNLVTRVTDDLGMSIPDYFLEFYERPHTPEEAVAIDALMVKVHTDVLQDVHNYKPDESYRSFIFDLTTLNGAISGGEELVFSLSAANPTTTIGYSVGNANSVGELPVDKDSPSYPLFWRPNETLLMDITVERIQDAKLFQFF